jgi:hypothetical protein
MQSNIDCIILTANVWKTGNKSEVTFLESLKLGLEKLVW